MTRRPPPPIVGATVAHSPPASAASQARCEPRFPERWRSLPPKLGVSRRPHPEPERAGRAGSGNRMRPRRLPESAMRPAPAIRQAVSPSPDPSSPPALPPEAYIRLPWSPVSSTHLESSESRRSGGGRSSGGNSRSIAQNFGVRNRPKAYLAWTLSGIGSAIYIQRCPVHIFRARRAQPQNRSCHFVRLAGTPGIDSCPGRPRCHRIHRILARVQKALEGWRDYAASAGVSAKSTKVISERAL